MGTTYPPYLPGGMCQKWQSTTVPRWSLCSSLWTIETGHHRGKSCPPLWWPFRQIPNTWGNHPTVLLAQHAKGDCTISGQLPYVSMKSNDSSCSILHPLTSLYSLSTMARYIDGLCNRPTIEQWQWCNLHSGTSVNQDAPSSLFVVPLSTARLLPTYSWTPSGNTMGYRLQLYAIEDRSLLMNSGEPSVAD